MRAEIIGTAAGFEVEPEQRPDGSWGPPATVSLTMRPCWQKPAVHLSLEYLYTNAVTKVAVYAEKKP